MCSKVRHAALMLSLNQAAPFRSWPVASGVDCLVYGAVTCGVWYWKTVYGGSLREWAK